MDRQQILSLSVKDLKRKLTQLKLSAGGKKHELQDRLILHLESQPDIGDSVQTIIQRDVENEEADVLNEDDFADTSQREQNEFRNDNINSPMGITSTPYFRENIASNFSFKDIEESVSAFTGENNQSVVKWIEEFEDISSLVHWNDLQKYIYAKRLITGSAKLFVNGTPTIRSWLTLKIALVKEFSITTSSANIHRQLRNRRKQPKETLREYLYTMIEIASPIKIDEESIIEYVIDGIKDDKTNKAVLYEASTIEEFKSRLRIYEKLKAANQNDEPRRFKHTNYNAKQENQIPCSKYGNKSHFTNKDMNKPKNYKCFKCNAYGHRSFECKKQLEQEVKIKSEYTANIAYKRTNMMKNIVIQGESVNALVDTGCDLILCRKDLVNKLKNVQIIPSTVSLTVLGNREIRTNGFFATKLMVDDLQFDVTCHVIAERDMFFEFIIGNELLKQASVLIDQNGIQFSRVEKIRPMAFKPVEYNRISELHNEFQSICYMGEFKGNLQSSANVASVDLNHLPAKEKMKVMNLIENYKPQQRFESPIEMSLILRDEKPIYEGPRRMSEKNKKEVERQIASWLEDKIIQPSTSEFAAPVVLVSKKDGSKRLCCDYRRINKQIEKDHFPLPLIDDVLDQLQKAKVFTTLDLTNGFFHVPIAPNSRKYTSFIIHNGQYEFLKVPFGVCNSPAIFSRYISAVFRQLVKDEVLLTYMDDLVIPAENINQAVIKLQRVLQVASDYGLKIKWEKSQIMQSQIDFLGYIIENGTIRPSFGKIKTVAEFPTPQDKKELQRFLGLTSYFRRFIGNYAVIAKPLSDLLRKDTSFEFGSQQQNAFQVLKSMLSRSPVLKLFDQNAYTEIHTDASKDGFGAILLQKDSTDQQLHPVQYMSRKTSPTEQRYHSYELEVLAIVQALKKWRIYVLDKRIKIITDCNAFTMTMKKKDVPLRVARWAMYLQDFDYEIEHRSGTKMRHVDALSRIAMVITDTTTYHIKQAQMADNYLKVIKKILETSQYEDFYIKNGILFKDPDKELMVIPASMEEEIIRKVHRRGHFSAAKTEELIMKNYFIPNLRPKVAQSVTTCIECIMAERKTGKQEGLLMPIDKGDRPLQTFHVDHIGPMEETKKKYNYILVVIDAFSKFTWLYPTKSTTGEEVVDRLRKQSAVFGNPRRIISDRGTAFTCKLFKEYCEKEGVQHLLITTGVPRGNGQAERLNRILIPLITKMSIEEPTAWYKHVDRAQQIINNTPTRSTKFTPFKILTGLDMRVSGIPNLNEIVEEECLNELSEVQENIRQEAKRNIAQIQQENYHGFNKKRKVAQVYNLNDLVAVKRTQFGAGLKLKPKFLGPYRIVERYKHDRYAIEKVGDHEGPMSTTAAADGLKPWGRSFEPNEMSGRPDVGSRKLLRSGNTF